MEKVDGGIWGYVFTAAMYLWNNREDIAEGLSSGYAAGSRAANKYQN